tara:strand:- start:339 stop:1013 length:675 start_codon:yes stop_codon:yes gene_type:complete
MALTQGHCIACCDRNRRGGLKRIWLMEQGNLGDVAYAAAGAGPGNDAHGGEFIQFAGTAWYEFEFDRGTAGFTANATRENGSTLVNVELEFYIPKITEEINARLRELTESCGVMAIVETYADDCDSVAPETYFFILGYDKVFEKKAYLEFSSGEQTTGVGLQDANGTAVKLAGVHAEYPREAMIIVDSGQSLPSSSASLNDYLSLYHAGGTDCTGVWHTGYVGP